MILIFTGTLHYSASTMMNPSLTLDDDHRSMPTPPTLS